VRYVYADDEVLDSDGMVVGDGTLTITLPTAVGREGIWFVIKRTQTGIVTIKTTGGETIDGSDCIILNYAEYGTWTTINVVSDGENWLRL
jgi:hypothetical protein